MKSINANRNLLTRFLTATAMLLVSTAAWAQAELTGTVTDAQNEPLPGVMVSDKANNKWASTDIDGKFHIANPIKGCTLEVTYLGYTPKKIVWNGENPLDIVMDEESFALEETVVIGYGTVKKKDLTGSVGMVGSDILGNQRAPQLSQGLQGAIPGLNITRSGSMPGSSGSIKVRGITTLSDNNPLILVDGMPISDIDNVNPDDVEQISVLKDAASASIYGARAAAGVILITTKSAKDGDVSISYNGEVSLTHATEFPEYVGPIEYMTMYNELRWNDAGNAPGSEYSLYSKDYIDNYFENNRYDPIEYPLYDWAGELLKSNAMRHKHVLSLTYGNKVIKSRISASYENSDALYEGSNHERIFVRAKNSLNFNKNWSADVDLSVKHAIKNDPYSGSPIRAAHMYPAIYLGTYPDGRVAPGQSGSNTLAAFREGGTKQTRNDYITGKLALSWKPFDFLTITGTVTPTLNFTKRKEMKKAIPYYDAYETDVRLGYISGYESNDLAEARTESWSLEKSLIVTFNKEFRKNNVNVMVGYEDYFYNYETLSAGSTRMDLGSFPYLDLANKNNLTVGGSAFQNAYRSFFGRAMYNYDHRYFIQANVRADASSRFHKDYRWGVFPSVSAGWTITQEKFMEDVTDINNLMIRGSFGTLGNERIGNYPYQAAINFANALMFDQANGTTTAQKAGAQLEYAVRDITWETTQTWDVGFDISLLNYRLDVTADYYYKKTKDMLLNVAIPGFTGFSDPKQNAGDMYTRGWEVKVGWKDRIGDWSYGIGFNISDYRSIMGNLNGTVSYSGDCIIREGDEYMSFYGYKADGLFQTETEVANSAVLIANTKPGDIKYKDLSGAKDEPDGKIDATYDRTILGSSLPHFLYGGYLNVGWNGIRLSAMFNGVGQQKIKITEAMVRPYSSWLSPPSNIVGKYWSVYNTAEQNAKAIYPRMSNASAESNYKMSDFWLMNGAYMRVKNINLSYTFPATWTKKISVQNLRVYFNVEDPFCFDHYLKGWDPEMSTSGSNYIATTYTFGIDLKF